MSDNPFSKRNLFKEPAVLQFLVERAQSDQRLVQRLLTTIEQSKSDTAPSLAAANAITILVKAGKQLDNAGLRGVRIPADYVFEEESGLFPLEGTDADVDPFVMDLLDRINTSLARTSLSTQQEVVDPLSSSQSSDGKQKSDRFESYLRRYASASSPLAQHSKASVGASIDISRPIDRYLQAADSSPDSIHSQRYGLPFQASP
ncbi:hypothetical protein BGX29_001430 [Mortierella sp. GBA35]|nr:hypothetical protein BGX29_001430 [Mortierella sp. GBA35]